MATTPRPPALPPWMPTRETTLKAAAATVGLAGILAGCSSGTKDNGSAVASTVKQTTTTVAPATTAPTTTAAPATTAAATPAGAPAAAPSGAQQLQNASANGATYWRYSIIGTTPAQVVSDYQGELQAAGYSVTDQGGSGGGWGKWGGAGAGLTGQDGGNYVSVQAGGQSSGPTFFEVCLGPSSQSVQDCENVSDGPNDQNNNGDSNSGAS
jgi:hypothetical protein